MAFARLLRPLLAVCLVLAPLVASAQQTGALSGRVTDTDGLALPGVTVEARADVLPVPRVAITGGNGDYRLPALPPGTYTITFALAGMQTVTREARVQLAQTTVADATLGVAGLTEVVTVTAGASLIDRGSSAISSSVSADQILALPVGQEYRDLVKLIPGVQYTEEQVRGPSAGGSGQDNVYQFDGVNVTLPLFGTLSAEPASHDIDQVTTIKGGAQAINFDRSGGFTIDSVSKSGTSRYQGMLSYQLQNNAMAAELESGSRSRYEQDRTWLTGNVGGPILQNRLFFYGSYYRPTRTRDNQANLYGELPAYESTRNEGFGKLTFTPSSAVLLNASYRDSKREDISDLFAANASATTGSGSELRLRIATVDGSWVINDRSFLTFKYTNFANRTQGRPDSIASVTPSTQAGTRLDVTSLDSQGRLTVPTPVAGATAYNAFIQPLIDRYGSVQNGQRIGGGIVGFGAEFNDQDFFRNAGQVAYNITFGGNVSHDVHVGYQLYQDAEDLVRSSNGWGLISVPGGRLAPIAGTGQSAFYTARFQQQSIGVAPKIRSEYLSQSIEVNDTIRWQNWAFNLGVLVSNDTLYGQGLREDASTLSGYVSAPGNKYNMYELPFSKMIQPRVGATWAYNGNDTVYASYARYHPAASSLPRAASWDRNLIGTFIDAHFDQTGTLFAAVPVGSSSGKLFVEDMTPRTVDEFLVGTARQINPQWSMRFYGRYREGSHFWEDTNNNARVAFNPPANIPRELYITDLSQRLAQIGSGSSYVIAELDGAYTKFYEATVESEWRGSRAFVRGSYTWSRYTGNFDQDNTTTGNDANVFMGSSFIADAAGRQLWDFRDGTLRGDRPHMLKVYGFYNLGWNASVGAFAVAQSGQPWEEWSFEPYRSLTTSTSSTSRFAEPAGSRRSDAHWQLDLNYTQNVRLAGRSSLQIALDLFNVMNNQTGYDIQPVRESSVFGQPRAYFDPRRIQIAARLLF
ncbi:MAG: carboxypeptidase regulatory-like domain-containing protein [Vicinamibacterales bacterium]|nr:carboxypeptidase regulatory-like domain-containing protein [Vicinamibacterales bacterium]